MTDDNEIEALAERFRRQLSGTPFVLHDVAREALLWRDETRPVQSPPAAVSLPAPLPPAPDTMNLTEAQREIEDAFRRGWNSCRATVMQAPPAAAPDCGCCKGDGSMCPNVCRHAEENPPAFGRLPESEAEAEALGLSNKENPRG